MLKLTGKFLAGLVISLLLISCNTGTDPQPKDLTAGEPKEIKISMNEISRAFSVKITTEKINIDEVQVNILSSDSTLIDSSSIDLSVSADTVYFIIKPKIGKHGWCTLTLLIRDDNYTDVKQFKVVVTYDPKNSEYPAILLPNHKEKLEPSGIDCPFPLDRYGLIRSGFFQFWPENSKISDVDSAISIAKRAIVKYSYYSFVYHESDLVVNEAVRSDDSYKYWKITFSNQVYEGLEILNTEIFADVADTVTHLRGHHFLNINVPGNNIIPKERLAEILTGQVVNWYCKKPESLVIAPESISPDIEKCIIWREIETHTNEFNNYIEFRVVWKVPVYDIGTSVGWYFYVDVLTGEIIKVEQAFMC